MAALSIKVKICTYDFQDFRYNVFLNEKRKEAMKVPTFVTDVTEKCIIFSEGRLLAEYQKTW